MSIFWPTIYGWSLWSPWTRWNNYLIVYYVFYCMLSRCTFVQPHRIHGTGIFTYIYHKFKPNVGKYNIPVPWILWGSKNSWGGPNLNPPASQIILFGFRLNFRLLDKTKTTPSIILIIPYHTHHSPCFLFCLVSWTYTWDIPSVKLTYPLKIGLPNRKFHRPTIHFQGLC